MTCVRLGIRASCDWHELVPRRETQSATLDIHLRYPDPRWPSGQAKRSSGRAGVLVTAAWTRVHEQQLSKLPSVGKNTTSRADFMYLSEVVRYLRPGSITTSSDENLSFMADQCPPVALFRYVGAQRYIHLSRQRRLSKLSS